MVACSKIYCNLAPNFARLILDSLNVAHEEVCQHNTDVVTNYGHGETIGRILG